MAKAQDRYASVVNKKRREMTFHVGKKVWLDSKNLEIPTKLSIKWSVRWIVSGEENPSSEHVRVRLRQKSWHPVFHVSLLKKYHQDEKDLSLCQLKPITLDFVLVRVWSFGLTHNSFLLDISMCDSNTQLE